MSLKVGIFLKVRKISVKKQKKHGDGLHISLNFSISTTIVSSSIYSPHLYGMQSI